MGKELAVGFTAIPWISGLANRISRMFSSTWLDHPFFFIVNWAETRAFHYSFKTSIGLNSLCSCACPSPHFFQSLCLDDVQDLFWCHWGIGEVLQYLSKCHVFVSPHREESGQNDFEINTARMWSLISRRSKAPMSCKTTWHLTDKNS